MAMQDPVATTRSPTPQSYALAISDLTTPQIDAELARLAISETKLRETNETLSLPEWRDETFALDAIKENEQVLISYNWRRRLVREELEKRGISNHGSLNGAAAGIEL